MPHEVEIHDGLVVVTLHQSQGEEEVKQIAKKIVDFSGGNKYDILVNASGVSGSSDEGTPEAIKQLKLIPFKRLAIFGPSPKFANQQIKAVTIAAGEPERIKFFRREQDARDWLGAKPRHKKPYSLTLIDDTIEIGFSDDMNEQDVIDLKREVLNLSKDTKYNILVDMTGVPANTYQPDNLHEYFDDLPFRRYAIFGGAHQIMLPLKELVESLPEDPNFRFFRNEQDARDWLRE